MGELRNPYHRSIYFTVIGEPRGLGRHRTVLGRNGKLHNYPDNKSEASKGDVCNAFIAAAPDWKMVDGEPVRLAVMAYSLAPKSVATKKNLGWIAKGLWQKLTKPDADNVAKLVMDALNGTAWRDDAIITDLHVFKRYTEQTPRLEVHISVMKRPGE